MRILAIVLSVLALSACAKDAPRQVLSPGTRLIYHGGSHGVYTMCDRGNRVYMTETGLFQVVPGGCPDGQP